MSVKKLSNKRFDSDFRLMQEVAGGDSAAFKQFYEKYEPVVRGYLASRNGHGGSLDDLVQEVFLRILQNAGRFRGNSTVKTYCLGIAKYVLAEHWRELAKSKQLDKVHLLDILEARASTTGGPEAKLLTKELDEIIEQALTALTTEQGRAIQTVHFQDIPISRAAQHSGCSTAAFDGRVRRAYKRLRGLLEQLKPQETAGKAKKLNL